ncbi:MAG: zinc ABC transporter solute-binding protein [Spirochaetales bacterium]|nr:zinc ABC transporter solute-binding protein [Spirochaetales bacterium]
MRRNVTVGIALLLLGALALMTSCTSGDKDRKTDDRRKTVTVTTSFIHDMVQHIAGDTVNLELIIPHGVDPHLYQAKPDDLGKITRADLLLYHGLHFEGKMQDILKKDGHAITSTFRKEDLITMEEDGFNVVDPHFWFDLTLYKEAFVNTCNELVRLLPEEKEIFEERTIRHLEALDALHHETVEKINRIEETSRYLITPHDAFNYFSRSYAMEVVAPQGVSTESEVSNADLEKTARFIVDHRIRSIFTESTTNPEKMKKLQEICRSKGFEVAVIHGDGKELFSDSLAPVGEPGDTFIDMFRHNVDLIVDNLT